MKKMKYCNSGFIMIFLISLITTRNCFSQDKTGDILKSNDTPKYFLQEGINTPNKQSGPAFTMDGEKLYLADNNVIKGSFWKNGKWTKPVTLSFSGKFHDWDPVVSADGKFLIFVSNRPTPNGPEGKLNNSNQLWMAELISKNEWAEPKLMDANINPPGISSYGPTIGKDKTLYFSSTGRDSSKVHSAYYSKWLGDHYDVPVKLNLNGNQDVLDPFLSANGLYIIFKSGYDLYICYRENDNWSKAYKLGKSVNNGSYNTVPRISPDGKTLYYSSSNANGILMIPINIPKL